MLRTKNIPIQKHIRVFSSGNTKTANEIWILFHGYGQNIKTFFEPFKHLNSKAVFIIPEGISRFYQKGIHGKVGASWMTSENRELEIIDQYNYLNQVFNEYELSGKKINIFAFSQGAPVAARWIEKFKIKVNRLIFWSGNIPESVSNNLNGSVNLQNPEFYVGKKDQFTSLKVWMTFFEKHNHFKPVFYDGNHFFTSQQLAQFVFN
jgi:predicted esterase